MKRSSVSDIIEQRIIGEGWYLNWAQCWPTELIRGVGTVIVRPDYRLYSGHSTRSWAHVEQATERYEIKVSGIWKRFKSYEWLGETSSDEGRIYRLTDEQGVALRDEHLALVSRTKAAAEAANSERQKPFDEAKDTGKAVLIEQYESGCSDPNEQCSLDIVTVWAMPSGEEKVERRHTW